jgi:hypothetical protein
MKLMRNDSAWDRAYEDLLAFEMRAEPAVPLPSHFFLRHVEEEAGPDRAERIRLLESKQLPHPTDSHPPLKVRLSALGFSVAELYDAAGDIRSAEPSSTIFPDPDAIERAVLPKFAAKSTEVMDIFGHWQAGFAALEYHSGVLNSSYIVYIGDLGLYGFKIHGTIMAGDSDDYFVAALQCLENPWFIPETPEFEKALRESAQNFSIPFVGIRELKFDARPKIGAVSNSGKLQLRASTAGVRELILLGQVNGARISQYVKDRWARQVGVGGLAT